MKSHTRLSGQVTAPPVGMSWAELLPVHGQNPDSGLSSPRVFDLSVTPATHSLYSWGNAPFMGYRGVTAAARPTGRGASPRSPETAYAYSPAHRRTRLPH